MPKLSNFTMNSDYPAIAKTGYSSVSVTMPSITLAPQASNRVTAEADVSSGDILSPIIQIGVGGGCFYGTGFRRISGYFVEEFWVERISPTRVRAVFFLSNSDVYNYRTYNGETIIFHLNAFRVP